MFGTKRSDSTSLNFSYAFLTKSTCSPSFDSKMYTIASHLFSMAAFSLFVSSKSIQEETSSSGTSVSAKYLMLYLSLFFGSLSFIALTTERASASLEFPRRRIGLAPYPAATLLEAAATSWSLCSSCELLAMMKESIRVDLPEPEAPTSKQLNVLR